MTAAQWEKDASSALQIFADGLDASIDGRGYGKKHEAARQKILGAFRVASLNAELVAACNTAIDNLGPLYPQDYFVMKKLRAALEKARNTGG